MFFLFCDVHNKHLLLLYGLPHSTGVIADLPYALPFPSDDTSNESHGDIYPLLSGRDGEGNVSINPKKTKWLLVFTIISRVFLDLGHPRLSLKVKLLEGFRVCKVWAGLEFGSPKLVIPTSSPIAAELLNDQTAVQHRLSSCWETRNSTSIT